MLLRERLYDKELLRGERFLLQGRLGVEVRIEGDVCLALRLEAGRDGGLEDLARRA